MNTIVLENEIFMFDAMKKFKAFCESIDKDYKLVDTNPRDSNTEDIFKMCALLSQPNIKNVIINSNFEMTTDYDKEEKRFIMQIEILLPAIIGACYVRKTPLTFWIVYHGEDLLDDLIYDRSLPLDKYGGTDYSQSPLGHTSTSMWVLFNRCEKTFILKIANQSDYSNIKSVVADGWDWKYKQEKIKN